MPAASSNLRDDALAFLEVRRAPQTTKNIQNVMDFLAANPDRRPSNGAAVSESTGVRENEQARSNASAAMLEQNVEKSMQPRVPMNARGPVTNDQKNPIDQGRLDDYMDKRGAARGSVGQSNVNQPQQQPAAPTPDAGAIPGGGSADRVDASGIGGEDFVDPNNPPNAMAGASTSGNLSSIIAKLMLPAGAIAAGVGLNRLRASPAAATALRNRIEPTLGNPGMRDVTPNPQGALPPPGAGNRPAPSRNSKINDRLANEEVQTPGVIPMGDASKNLGARNMEGPSTLLDIEKAMESEGVGSLAAQSRETAARSPSNPAFVESQQGAAKDQPSLKDAISKRAKDKKKKANAR